MNEQDIYGSPIAAKGWITQIQEHGKVFGYSQVKAIELEEAWWVLCGMTVDESEWREL